MSTEATKIAPEAVDQAESPPKPPGITVYPEPIHIGAMVIAGSTEANQASQEPQASVQVADLTLAEAGLSATRLQRSRLLGEFVELMGERSGKLTAILGGVDVGKLRSLLLAENSLRYSDSHREGVYFGLKLLRVWTAIAPGTADDELLGRIDHLLSVSVPAVAGFEAVCAMTTALLTTATSTVVTAAHVSTVCSDEHKAALAASGISWPVTVAVCQGLYEILKGLSISK